jgi:hypothetical protein
VTSVIVFPSRFLGVCSTASALSAIAALASPMIERAGVVDLSARDDEAYVDPHGRCC